MRRPFLLLLILVSMNVQAQKRTKASKTVALQEDTVTAPYLKYKDLPAFDVVNIKTKDTFNTYNIPTGKPTLIIYFGPDCDHCRKLLDVLLPQMDQIKNVDVYMMSFAPAIALELFNGTYHVEQYPNIKMIGQDLKIFFPGFYGISSVPDMVLYDKNKKYIKLWKDHITIEEILAELK